MNKVDSLSICVPAFNEENTLKEAVEDLISTLTLSVNRLDIIIINDGSKDSTSDIAEQLGYLYPFVRVIHHDKNQGIGVCYRNALEKASGEYFSWYPADHENEADEFLKCLPYLTCNTIVMCHHRTFDRRFVMRRLISVLYTSILNSFFSLNLKYYNGLAVFPARVLKSFPLSSSGFGIFAETIIKSILSGCKIVELATPLRGRAGGRSKAFTISSLSSLGKDLLVLLLQGKRTQRFS